MLNEPLLAFLKAILVHMYILQKNRYVEKKKNNNMVSDKNRAVHVLAQEMALELSRGGIALSE